MAKERERKIADGLSPATLAPPYFHLSAPITGTSLIASDHHHWVVLRCRFIIRTGRRQKQLLEQKQQQLQDEDGVDLEVPPTSTTRPTSANAANGRHLIHAAQLGRPTKSNINAQRVIADLSVATVLNEEGDEPEVCGKLLFCYSRFFRQRLRVYNTNVAG